MTSIRADIAAHIRSVDGGNELGPHELATSIAGYLRDCGVITDDALVDEVEDFAYEQNRGAGYRNPKPLGPDALAKAIVDAFYLYLDQEN